MSKPVNPRHGGYEWRWFLVGLKGIFTLPALILMSTFVGFAGLARDAGLTLGQTIFMVPTIWALPSHILVVAGLTAGAGVLTTALAVALASIRMLPMTMALVPRLRADHTRPWHLLVVSNFIAITAWLFTLQRVDGIPRNGRLPFFAGAGLVLMGSVTLICGVVHTFAASLPPLTMAALTFLTPLYFAAMIYGNAKLPSERLAMALGLLFGPLFVLLLPQANVLAAGLLGGCTAYAFRFLHRRRAASS
ncbi:MAG: AzlC family ABC transporter permease [Pseudomonadota bacterium]